METKMSFSLVRPAVTLLLSASCLFVPHNGLSQPAANISLPSSFAVNNNLGWLSVKRFLCECEGAHTHVLKAGCGVRVRKIITGLDHWKEQCSLHALHVFYQDRKVFTCRYQYLLFLTIHMFLILWPSSLFHYLLIPPPSLHSQEVTRRDRLFRSCIKGTNYPNMQPKSIRSIGPLSTDPSIFQSFLCSPSTSYPPAIILFFQQPSND